MAKKKDKSVAGVEESDNFSQDQSTASTTSTSSSSKSKAPKASQPSTSALIICRNKHWRYISSFHGPWLQLPLEVLESLANNNYTLPRPRPIDPAVFYDLLKIRKLVDDATNLAVRAASGVTSNVSNNLNASNGMFGSNSAALGIGIGSGGSAKLSRERKHRMREQATQKLSKAYHLDEIACSVATMQSASSLEDVAHLVLQRSPLDSDAKYVHFFHEKIPSRQLAECTSLQPLDEVIADRPNEAEILRTRAVTKIFKDDFVGAAHDLTLALQVCRYVQAKHRAGRQQLLLASEKSAADAQRNGRWREELKLDEEDHPSSLETQLLFHRAGVYLTIACQHVHDALPPKPCRLNGSRTKEEQSPTSSIGEEVDTPEMSPVDKEVHRKRLEARKNVKTNAKRALRDYIAYLAHLDYTPGVATEITEEFVRKVNQAASGTKAPKSYDANRVMDLDSNASLSNGQLSDALVPTNARSSRYKPHSRESHAAEVPNLPSPVVHQMSALFSATPPSDLPPYPETSTALAIKQKVSTPQSEAAKAIIAQTDCHEALTYHPLLTDALHSLLLCHCLVQTSTRELQRHAHMVARLARVCDGYPIFQAARSPSRADWIEVLRRSDNFIQLATSWESLCAPAPLPGQTYATQQKETASDKKERLRQQAIMEALEDDRVHDEVSFHAAVAARQRRQEEEARKAEGREMPKRWAQEDGKEYPISTERAHAIVRWIKEAPIGGDSGGVRKKKKSTKSGVNGKVKGVQEAVEELSIADDSEKVDEEVD